MSAIIPLTRAVSIAGVRARPEQMSFHICRSSHPCLACSPRAPTPPAPVQAYPSSKIFRSQNRRNNKLRTIILQVSEGTTKGFELVTRRAWCSISPRLRARKIKSACLLWKSCELLAVVEALVLAYHLLLQVVRYSCTVHAALKHTVLTRTLVIVVKQHTVASPRRC